MWLPSVYHGMIMAAIFVRLLVNILTFDIFLILKQYSKEPLDRLFII